MSSHTLLTFVWLVGLWQRSPELQSQLTWKNDCSAGATLRRQESMQQIRIKCARSLRHRRNLNLSELGWFFRPFFTDHVCHRDEVRHWAFPQWRCYTRIHRYTTHFYIHWYTTHPEVSIGLHWSHWKHTPRQTIRYRYDRLTWKGKSTQVKKNAHAIYDALQFFLDVRVYTIG